MAAPPVVNLRNFNGYFALNKTLSDDSDPLLALQGVNWLTRKALGLASVTLHITQHVDEKGITHISTENIIGGMGSTSTELRLLDGEERERDVKVFGRLRGRSRWVELAEVEDGFLRMDWALEQNREGFLEGHAISIGNCWVQDQIWGFETVGGERRHVRRVVVTKEGQRKEARFVYDWLHE